MILFEKLELMVQQYSSVITAAKLIGADLPDFDESYNTWRIFRVRDSNDTIIDKVYLKDIFELKRIFENYDEELNSKFLNEIDQNLFLLQNTENRIIYVKRIIRRFTHISILFDLSGNPEVNLENLKIGKQDYDLVLGENDLNTIKKCNSFLDDFGLGRKTPTKPAFSFAERYLLRCFIDFLFFADGLLALLHEFNISLLEIQAQVGTGIIFTKNVRLILEVYGFTQHELRSIFSNMELPVDYSISEIALLEKDCRNNPTILAEPVIRELRKEFDDILWVEEDITDEEFLNYWRPGTKDNALPLTNKTGFIYLWENYLINLLKNKNITQKKRAEIFHLTESEYTDLKSKSKKNKNTDTVKKINTSIINLNLTYSKPF